MAEKKAAAKPKAKPAATVTSDDKLWAALAYVFAPVVPIILLLMEDKKDRPFIKAHNVQALIWGILIALPAATLILSCVWPIGWLVSLFWAYKAYQGEMVNIPVISDFVKNQGWA
jgi:uncharacterized membrane protein